MSLQIHPATSQAVRHGDRRHAASIARQRQHATHNPRQQAEAIAKIVRKKISDQQAVPDLDRYGLNDAVWAELLDILSADELSALADACGGDDISEGNDEPSAADITSAFEDDVPFTPEPPAPDMTVAVAHVASWRDHEAPVVHSVTWTDAEGLNHMHCVRGDTLDEVLLHLRKVKVCIDAAKAKAKTQEPKADPELSSRRCELHDVPMVKAISRKTGRPYASHMTADGERCFGRKA